MSIENTLSGFSHGIKALEANYDERDEQIRRQNLKINELEIETRKRNVVLYKLQECESDPVELERNVLKLLNEKSGMSTTSDHLENVFRMGKKVHNVERFHPVLNSFVSLKTKNSIMQKVKVFVEARRKSRKKGNFYFIS